MIIANPIYDVVFKRLMEDKRIARFFIETLTSEEISEIEVKPQEFTYNDQLAGISVYRLDFIATIKTQDKGYKKVLIEIQKAKNAIDLMRFRNYLGEQYKKEEQIQTDTGIEKTALPIITIYMLGFKLPEIESSVIQVKREYTDLLTNTVLHQKSEFIEKLTHDCYVVQIPRIQSRIQSKLDRLLSLFEQNYFADDREITKNYTYPVSDETIKNMIDVLHYAGTDPAEKEEIEKEQEALRVFDVATKELRQTIAQKDKALSEKNKALSDKDKVLSEKDKSLLEKDKALQDSLKLIEDLKRRLGEG